MSYPRPNGPLTQASGDTEALTRLGTIGAILPDEPDSWRGRCFITIDVDWASDDVLDHAVDVLEQANAAATWFVTHDTPLLKRLRANPLFEIGIHPNFNPLLEGNGQGSSANSVLGNLQRLVPEARGVRSHSMTQSTRLLDAFQKIGMTHDCNHFIPLESGVATRPWRHWNGLIRIPYCWEDDIWLSGQRKTTVRDVLDHDGLMVVDFHPIHIALNCTDLDTYEKSRPVHRDWARLRTFTSPGNGVRAFLDSLLAAA